MFDGLIIKAAQFAMRAHDGQKRKFTGTPYIWHPMRVAGRACLLPGTYPEQIAAAWLHDVIEDCNVTLGELDREFGGGPSSMVWDLTNPSKKFPDLSREERKAMDRQHLRTRCLAVRQIKLLDRIDNIRELDGCDREFYDLYRDESSLLLDALKGTDEQLEEDLRQLLMS